MRSKYSNSTPSRPKSLFRAEMLAPAWLAEA